MNNAAHEANQRHWDRIAAHWAEIADERGIWQRCSSEPECALDRRELAFLQDISGRNVCVLGSGDNEVVFALAGLGASVTSVDICAQQLDVARQRAETLGLPVSFLQADVTDLSALADATYDLVYTGGHVAVWVSDLRRYYAEAVRILRPEGLFVVSEYHPFRRLWQWGTDRLELAYGYFDRGPHRYEEEGPDETGQVHYEFHWTVSDYVTALLQAGCGLLACEEFDDGPESWENPPVQGLPRVLLLVGRKGPHK